MLLCARCGEENHYHALVCAGCGARMNGQDEAASSQDEAASFATARLKEKETKPQASAPPLMGEVERSSAGPLVPEWEKRDPLVVLLLGFLTCYMYLFYWWYVTGADIRRATGRSDINPPLELVLNLLTCSLFSIFLSYKYPKLILEMQEKAGVVRNDTSLLSVLLSIFSLGPIACYVIQEDLNRIRDTLKPSEP